MIQIPFAYCEHDHNIYPAHTPRTYIPRQDNYNTEFTVDINPKYWMVENVTIDWHVRLQVDVLEDNKVSRIVIVTWVPDPDYSAHSDFDSGTVFVMDSKGNTVGEMVKNYYSSPCDGDFNWFYLGVVETDGYFEKEEYFYVEFEEHIVRFEDPPLITHYAASGNMENEGVDRIYIWLVRGPEFSTVPPNPMFATPEYPLGVIVPLIMMVVTTIIWSRKYRLKI